MENHTGQPNDMTVGVSRWDPRAQPQQGCASFCLSASTFITPAVSACCLARTADSWVAAAASCALYLLSNARTYTAAPNTHTHTHTHMPTHVIPDWRVEARGPTQQQRQKRHTHTHTYAQQHGRDLHATDREPWVLNNSLPCTYLLLVLGFPCLGFCLGFLCKNTHKNTHSPTRASPLSVCSVRSIETHTRAHAGLVWFGSTWQSHPIVLCGEIV